MTKRLITFFLIAGALLLLSVPAGAQRYSVSTNFIEWANLVTMNVEGGVAVSQHFSVHAGVRLNPWVWRPGVPDDRFADPAGDDEKQFQNKKQSYCLSARWWPWYVYSGWWGYAKAQYSEYDHGGFLTHQREAGDAYGLGLGVGYTYMLHENWNIEFGAGLWGGKTRYGTYRCTNCGQPVESGQKFFILPDDVMVSLIYIF